MTDRQRPKHVVGTETPFARIKRRLASLDEVPDSNVELDGHENPGQSDVGEWSDDPDPLGLDWAWIPNIALNQQQQYGRALSRFCGLLGGSFVLAAISLSTSSNSGTIGTTRSR